MYRAPDTEVASPRSIGCWFAGIPLQCRDGYTLLPIAISVFFSCSLHIVSPGTCLALSVHFYVGPGPCLACIHALFRLKA